MRYTTYIFLNGNTIFFSTYSDKLLLLLFFFFFYGKLFSINKSDQVRASQNLDLYIIRF